MTLPASDTFLQTSGGPQALNVYSANWQQAQGTFNVPNGTGDVRCTASGVDHLARWTADTPNADHYTEITPATGWAASGRYIGPAVRVSSAASGYSVQATGGDWVMGRMVSGAWTSIGSGSWTAVDGQPIRLEVTTVDASTVRLVLKRNGTTVTTIDDTSGSRITAANSLGFGGYDAGGSDPAIADWTGGNLAGGSGSTLTADTGTFALTGAAANLLFNRAVVASSGSFTLSGADATLIYSGSAATLVADNGSFNLAGTAANLLVGKRLTADGGSFVLTGSDSLSDLSMVASSGSYTLTGGAVTFIYSGSTYTLAANAGSFALTGANVGLVYSGSTYTLAADSGSYALTGGSTSFNVSHSIASNAGNFVLTGADVTFTKSTVYTLAADSGAFVYTGRSVNLIYSNAPVIRKKRMNNAITIRLGL